MATAAGHKWTKEEIRAAKTFELQPRLPPLPLPTLGATKARYLRSLKPFLTPEELAESTAVVERYFASEDAAKTQAALEERARTHRNWLAEWWLRMVYLQYREPLFPLCNFGGSSPRKELPPQAGSQLERAAVIGWLGAKFWHQVYQQKIPVMHTNAPVPLCMAQFGTIFNTCRIPQPSEDRMHCSFVTEQEEASGQSGKVCPGHVLVCVGGRYWKVQVFDRTTNQMISYSKFYAAMRHVLEMTRLMHSRPAVGALTCLPRDSWAAQRSRLIELSSKNETSLKDIEDSIFAISLTDENPRNESDLSYLAVAGDARYQWADKSMLWHVHKNGLISSSCDHTPNEGIVMVMLTFFTDSEQEKMGFKCPPWNENETLSDVSELEFDIDDDVRAGIAEGEATVRKYANNLDLEIVKYTKYSRDLCKQRGYSVDTIIQLAAQVGYYRLHSKPAPVYETASTKQFYHGRSETMKSCTPEALDFVRAMSSNNSLNTRFRKLQAAVKIHDLMLKGAQSGQGVDRHLLGLQIQSKILGLPDPPIFADPAFKKAGGAGNYDLSTSFLGGTNTSGGVVPMTADGYGFFYKATGPEITLFITAWRDSKESSLAKFRDSVIESLNDMEELIRMDMPKL